MRLLLHQGEPVYGILCAPPCTAFAVSGAQYWKAKDASGETLEALALVDACLRAVAIYRPKFWALENPVGRLRKFLGPPRLIFNPCDYGDAYTKKTLLWGEFNLPERNAVVPVRVYEQGSWLQRLITWAFQLVITVSLFAGKLYVDNHYVDKPHFDKAMAALSEDKQKYALEQRAELKEINGKLDAILQNNAANGQRFTDAERRLSRLENHLDRKYSD